MAGKLFVSEHSKVAQFLTSPTPLQPKGFILYRKDTEIKFNVLDSLSKSALLAVGSY